MNITAEGLLELGGTIGGLGLFITGGITLILSLIFEVQWYALLNPWDYYGNAQDYIFGWVQVCIYITGLTFCSFMSVALLLHLRLTI